MKAFQIACLLILYCALALVLPGCKTKQKAIAIDKGTVTKTAILNIDSTAHTTDNSREKIAETNDSEFTEETIFIVDSVKIDVKGNTTFYTGGKPVTTKKKGSNKQEKQSDRQNDIKSDKSVASKELSKSDSTFKKKDEIKKVSNESTGKVWGVAIVMGLVIVSIVYIVISAKPRS